jgi:hypothetical protein
MPPEDDTDDDEMTCGGGGKRLPTPAPPPPPPPPADVVVAAAVIDMKLADADRVVCGPTAATGGGGGKLVDEERMCFIALLSLLSPRLYMTVSDWLSYFCLLPAVVVCRCLFVIMCHRRKITR